MSSRTEIENAWFSFVSAAILANFPDYKVIIAEDNGPRPDKPYLTMKITGPNRVTTTDPKVYDEDEEKFKFVAHRRYNISFQSYGLDHTDVLDEIILGTMDPEFRSLLRECDIGVEIRGNITDITGLVSTAWEKRGSLDISFLTSKIKLTNIGPIESAEIDGEMARQDDTKIIVNKFTVPEP